jgi:FAD:protein FMN transferase
MKISWVSIIILFVASSFTDGSSHRHVPPVVVEGYTMGTTYHVTYFDDDAGRNFKNEIDSLLVLVNKSINTYDSGSEVSAFNRSKNGVTVNLPYLFPPLAKAKEIYSESDGAFDPTVMPLVNAWGFGPKKSFRPTPQQLDSILEFTGFDQIIVTEREISKLDPRVQLDFGGIGQGYGVDVISDFLRLKGIENFLVEIGGEGFASGKNLSKGKPWEIGILDPNSIIENQFFKAYASLHNRAFTTSGNYFNYREIDGKKYGHTIDPKTGNPIQHELLSASVFASDCSTADAWATAFMVMGVPKSIEKLKKMPHVDALLIYTSAFGKIETYITPGAKHFIRLEP